MSYKFNSKCCSLSPLKDQQGLMSSGHMVALPFRRCSYKSGHDSIQTENENDKFSIFRCNSFYSAQRFIGTYFILRCAAARCVCLSFLCLFFYLILSIVLPRCLSKITTEWKTKALDFK